MDNDRKYATVSWGVGDLDELRPEWDEDRRRSFLIDTQRLIQERMIEAGWSAIETLLDLEED